MNSECTDYGLVKKNFALSTLPSKQTKIMAAVIRFSAITSQLSEDIFYPIRSWIISLGNMLLAAPKKKTTPWRKVIDCILSLFPLIMLCNC